MIKIQLLGDCVIHADKEYDGLPEKSRKGVSLMTCLILQDGKRMVARRLIRELWGNPTSVNPESALKTLVSRTRGLLREIDESLASCIQSDAGGYLWMAQEGISVDVTEFMEAIRLAKAAYTDETREVHYRTAIELYRGDLFETGDMMDSVLYVNQLHREYLEAVYAYVELLKKKEAYNEILRICREAAKVDALDEQVHLELMKAMVNLNQRDQALDEYRAVTRNTRKVLGQAPGEDLKSYYRQLTQASQTVKFNLDVIRNELQAEDENRTGPFVCDYATFKEIYNIQMRNLERLNSTIFLAVIMLGEPDERLSTVRQESGMAALMEILKVNLRRGDIITRFSANTVAMLLPTVNYATGNMVLERIEKLFFEQYPASDVSFHFRISPMNAAAAM